MTIHCMMEQKRKERELKVEGIANDLFVRCCLATKTLTQSGMDGGDNRFGRTKIAV